MQSFKCRPRDKAQAVVHTRFSLDAEPIDAFQSLLDALAVVPARVVAQAPVRATGRVLRDVWDEARSLDEEEIQDLVQDEVAGPEQTMNHRLATEMVQLQRELDEIHRVQEMVQCGIAREPDPLRGFPANFKVEQKWKAPGVRQEIVTRRFKRLGIKN
jgi:hypothetical protein